MDVVLLLLVAGLLLNVAVLAMLITLRKGSL